MANGYILLLIQRVSGGSSRATHSTSATPAFFLIMARIAPGLLLLLTHQRKQTAGPGARSELRSKMRSVDKRMGSGTRPGWVCTSL